MDDRGLPGQYRMERGPFLQPGGWVQAVEHDPRPHHVELQPVANLGQVDHPGGVGQVAPARAKTSGEHPRVGIFEAPDLLQGEVPVLEICAREVRKQTVDLNLAELAGEVEKGVQVFRQYAQSAHAGIDLEVDRHGRTCPLRGLGKALEVLGPEYRGREPMGDHQIVATFVRSTEDEYRRSDSRVSQLDAFLDQRHPEHLHPLIFERLGDRHRPMTVGVGLDHGENLGAWRQRSNRRNVSRQGAQIDLRARWPDGNVERAPARGLRNGQIRVLRSRDFRPGGGIAMSPTGHTRAFGASPVFHWRCSPSTFNGSVSQVVLPPDASRFYSGGIHATGQPDLSEESYGDAQSRG